MIDNFAELEVGVIREIFICYISYPRSMFSLFKSLVRNNCNNFRIPCEGELTMIKKTLNYFVWIVCIGLVVIFIMGSGILNNFFEQKPTTTVSTRITSLEKVNQITFLNVGIQKVITSKETTKVLFTDLDLPFSEKEAIIILNYKARFGIKKPVKVQKLGQSSYKVIVPKFEVIGFELAKDNPYQLYDTSGGFLSGATDDVDTGKLVADGLTNKEQEGYLKEYKEMVKDSAKEYYRQILTSIDKDAKVECEFQD